jgi:hypothetical protein
MMVAAAGVAGLVLAQLSGETILQHMTSLKAEGSAGRSASRIALAAAGSSSTTRRRTRKANSQEAVVQPLPSPSNGLVASTPTAESDSCAVLPATGTGTQGAAASSHPLPQALPGAPWFKRLSVKSLMLSVDYNVQYSTVAAKAASAPWLPGDGLHPPLHACLTVCLPDCLPLAFVCMRP